VVTSESIPSCNGGKCIYRSEKLFLEQCGSNQYCVSGNGCVRIGKKYVPTEFTASLHVTSKAFDAVFRRYDFKLKEYIYSGLSEPSGIVLEVGKGDGSTVEVRVTSEVERVDDIEILRFVAGEKEAGESGFMWATVYVLDASKRPFQL